MPYIKHVRRVALEFKDNPMALGRLCESAGELNYVLTRVILGYLEAAPEGYAHYNAVLGVLSAVSQELYRRRIVPFEEQKCRENGDVF